MPPAIQRVEARRLKISQGRVWIYSISRSCRCLEDQLRSEKQARLAEPQNPSNPPTSPDQRLHHPGCFPSTPRSGSVQHQALPWTSPHPGHNLPSQPAPSIVRDTGELGLDRCIGMRLYLATERTTRAVCSMQCNSVHECLQSTGELGCRNGTIIYREFLRPAVFYHCKTINHTHITRLCRSNI